MGRVCVQIFVRHLEQCLADCKHYVDMVNKNLNISKEKLYIILTFTIYKINIVTKILVK